MRDEEAADEAPTVGDVEAAAATAVAVVVPAEIAGLVDVDVVVVEADVDATGAVVATAVLLVGLINDVTDVAAGTDGRFNVAGTGVIGW